MFGLSSFISLLIGPTPYYFLPSCNSISSIRSIHNYRFCILCQCYASRVVDFHAHSNTLFSFHPKRKMPLTLTLIPFFAPESGAKYRDVYVYLSVRSYNSKTMDEKGRNFLECCLWPWLGPPLVALRYVMYVLPVLWVTSYLHITALYSTSCLFLSGNKTRQA